MNSKGVAYLDWSIRELHPEWTREKLKEELSRMTGPRQVLSNGSQRVHGSSQLVHEGSQKESEAMKSPSSRTSSQRVHGSWQSPRMWLKLDHSIEKGQIILKESLDGISWRTVTILRKGQAFERNNIVISGTWHKGTVLEGDPE